MIFQPQTVQVFFKTESNRRAYADFAVKVREVVLARTSTLDELIETVGYRGSARAGAFEIQTNEGIVWHQDGKKIDNRTPRKRSKIVAKTWEELENEN